MKIQYLPSTFESDGSASERQHLTCVVVNDHVAVDAGSLAFACTSEQRQQIRDVILTHVHLDHIAGLPLFIDDLFATLTEPIRIHATREMIDILERDIFNWAVYPQFSELKNANGPVMEYCRYATGKSFEVKGLTVMPVAVNHNVQSAGMMVSDGRITVGITGDTAATDDIWNEFNRTKDLAAVFVECAFPDEMAELAGVSCHLTPSLLAEELLKFDRVDVPVYVVNIKPMHREKVIAQIVDLTGPNVSILEIGRAYEF